MSTPAPLGGLLSSCQCAPLQHAAPSRCSCNGTAAAQQTGLCLTAAHLSTARTQHVVICACPNAVQSREPLPSASHLAPLPADQSQVQASHRLGAPLCIRNTAPRAVLRAALRHDAGEVIIVQTFCQCAKLPARCAATHTAWCLQMLLR